MSIQDFTEIVSNSIKYMCFIHRQSFKKRTHLKITFFKNKIYCPKKVKTSRKILVTPHWQNESKVKTGTGE